ncbi:MAG: extracellular solute-binding protein [Planctomycetota bacterium]
MGFILKYLFVCVLLLLVVASLGLRLSFPGAQSDRPVIYWVTDRNPARELQVATFHEWLAENGHVDERGEPIVELRLDVANRDTTKQTIQSVSGVGGDLMDMPGQVMWLFRAMGVIEDITDDARAMGFGPEQTYEAIQPEITVEGRQYRYPANVTVPMLWVNPDTFRRYGLEPPPPRWTWDEFEALGIAFKEAANPPGTPASDRRFILSAVDSSLTQMYRSTGLSILNETLTASDLDDPRYVETLTRLHHWIYGLNILPTPDDVQAFDAAQGYGGVSLQLFNRGQYAMVSGGRWLLIQLRRFEGLGELSVVELPHRDFPNSLIATRAVALYKGSKHPELAKLFLAYLASDAYNELIVADADALPPNPKLTATDAFLRPADYPSEWGVHEAFVDAAQTIAIGRTYSPYILPTVMERIRKDYADQYNNNMIGAEAAARRTAEVTDRRIADNIRRKPELRDAYAADVALQKKIDELKEKGEPIPEAWVKNPFYREYYRQTGKLISEESTHG